jgi:hypothetical protein
MDKPANKKINELNFFHSIKSPKNRSMLCRLSELSAFPSNSASFFVFGRFKHPNNEIEIETNRGVVG